jgi:hypothetical protein
MGLKPFAKVKWKIINIEIKSMLNMSRTIIEYISMQNLDRDTLITS